MRQSSLWALLVLLLMTGCAFSPQEPGTARIRPSNEKHYLVATPEAQKEALSTQALVHWEYAVMSENAYHRSAVFPVGEAQRERLSRCDADTMTEEKKLAVIKRDDPRERFTEFAADQTETMTLLQRAKWTEWIDFMSDETWCAAIREGLAFKVYERTDPIDGVPVVAISFRGTVFNYGENWRANLRWFGQQLGDYPDANEVVRTMIADELAVELIRRHPSALAQKNGLRIVITGHSLGGALAQQMAYAFPPVRFSLEEYPSLKITKAVVFDSSPVNGWVSVDKKLRERNAGGLEITRAFQHGEGLAYLRLMLGYFYPVSDGLCDAQGKNCREPKISEVRYRVECPSQQGNPASKNRLLSILSGPIDQHSMQLLACGIATSAGQKPSNYP